MVCHLQRGHLLDIGLLEPELPGRVQDEQPLRRVHRAVYRHQGGVCWTWLASTKGFMIDPGFDPLIPQTLAFTWGAIGPQETQLP